MRREIGLDIDKVVECILVSSSEELVKVVERMSDYIEEETRTRLKVYEQTSEPEEKFYKKDWKIGQVQVRIALSKE